MKRFYLIFIIIGCGNLFAQLPVHADSVYAFIKNNSIHKNEVNWQVTDSIFRSDLYNAKSTEDTLKSFVHVLEQLNDVHSQIYFNNTFYGYYHNDYDNQEFDRLVKLRNKADSTTNQLKTEFIMNKYAYIRVPGYSVSSQSEIDSFGQILYDTVFYFARRNAQGFILDLRLNGGGSLYPMVSGLSLLLGDGTIGYEKDHLDTTLRKWEIKNGNFYLGENQVTNLKTIAIKKFVNLPVAVLIGPATRSSGSMTAITFKKRRFTKFFGEPTAKGYTTSNGYFQFAENLYMNFAIAFVADRKEIVYKENVSPDVTIANGDDFETLKNDLKVRASLNWLMNLTQQKGEK